MSPATLESLIAALESAVAKLTPPQPKPLTPCVEKLLEHAQDVTRELGLPYVSTECILIAMCRQNHGVPGYLLATSGITESAVRNAL